MCRPKVPLSALFRTLISAVPRRDIVDHVVAESGTGRAELWFATVRGIGNLGVFWCCIRDAARVSGRAIRFVEDRRQTCRLVKQ